MRNIFTMAIIIIILFDCWILDFLVGGTDSSSSVNPGLEYTCCVPLLDSCREQRQLLSSQDSISVTGFSSINWRTTLIPSSTENSLMILLMLSPASAPYKLYNLLQLITEHNSSINRNESSIISFCNTTIYCNKPNKIKNWKKSFIYSYSLNT